MDLQTHQALGLDQPTPLQANGRSNRDILASLNHPGDSAYHPCDEAHPKPDQVAGQVSKYPAWARTQVFPDTVRDVFVYIPPVPLKEPQLILFNDGAGYLSRTGAVRACAVLDTLHANQEIKPCVAVFANPGCPRDFVADGAGRTIGDYDAAMTQRSFEYDSLTPDFGRFVLDELLPFVESQHNFQFSADPAQRTVCGISSGGICAFNLAWHYPHAFGRVLSHCGSFTNIRGGHNYPYLVRSTPRKDLRVFLQSGSNDGQTLFGDWALANQTMANALQYAGYEVRFEFGTGGHSLRHGGAIFAESLRWLWGIDGEQAT